LAKSDAKGRYTASPAPQEIGLNSISLLPDQNSIIFLSTKRAKQKKGCYFFFHSCRRSARRQQKKVAPPKKTLLSMKENGFSFLLFIYLAEERLLEIADYFPYCGF